MAPRKMLTKPVEKALRKDMQKAIDDGRFMLNENQTIDDVIEYIRAEIKTNKYWPGITFDEFYATLTQDPVPASSGDDVSGSGTPSVNEELNVPEESAAPSDQAEIDDLADWLTLYTKAKAKEKECQEKADLAKRRIAERLDERGATVATIDGQPVATWTTVGQSYFDKKKFSSEYPDIADQFTTTRYHKRFDVK